MILKHVDLCSGIGGFALGFDWAKLSKPVLFCDIEPWSRQILKKHWPDVPIATDVKELANDPNGLIPDCDILTAGYPCQPFSQAGKRRGSEDDRHIWPHIFSIVKAKRPSWCVFENVYGHVTLGLNEVLSDLERESYATRPFVVPACATDAPHRRDRLWIICRNVADTDIINRRAVKKSKQSKGQTWRQSPGNSSSDVADAQSKRVQRHRASGQQKPQSYAREKVSLCSSERPRATTWNVEPPVGGMVNGISTWLDEPRDTPRVSTGVSNRAKRLKGLGNAIIPQIAMRIGQTIKEVM